MNATGLVLEGGGMRGVFTAGVLHYFMENEIYIPYVVGVSAGACNGSSYISRQIERNRIVNIDYISHPEYISIKRYFKNRELFGMDFLFNKLPNELVPFDFETFGSAREKFVVGTTDCVTGEPVYFEKKEYEKDMLTILRASSSLPFMAPEVEFQGRLLLDGGIADPIPIKKSETDGNTKNVVVLTRNKGYQKSKASFGWLLRRRSRHQGLVNAILERHLKYNQTVAYLEEKEARGEVFIIRPEGKLDVGRVERNPEKLSRLYQQGYEQAKKVHGQLNMFIG
ncbi:putative patatin/cPLA2 family phospholipase [Peribacillus deserti]|uniref:Patatin/cPLA2 family phospholipase n=1 Tax=Peribacillus deserti TaxID=673318 RepID=A0ABS2QDG9_9BACI|nr:patatin family protein [Peribacillus deserti]MBM7691183.1 putative patatin/cPLA2 family phospholipase [Peribacillus deserti]